MPPPDFSEYHKSISEELYALRDRVRALVPHRLTDGEHKETVLRTLLRRHLPSSTVVARGFIVSPSEASTQIDILLVDANSPTLYQDGDFRVVTPDVVRGIVEVKTTLPEGQALGIAATKLAQAARLCLGARPKQKVWTGLFSFQDEPIAHNSLLGALASAFQETRHPLSTVAVGRNQFVRFWPLHQPPTWSSYELPGYAPSYFVGNALESLGHLKTTKSGYAWFPLAGGKHPYLRAELPLPPSPARGSPLDRER